MEINENTASELARIVSTTPYYIARRNQHILNGGCTPEQATRYIIEDVVDDRIDSYELHPVLVEEAARLTTFNK